MSSFSASLAEFSANPAQVKAQIIENIGQIAVLNYAETSSLKDGTLVRFRGQVSDMMDSEIYLEKYEVTGPDGQKRVQDGKYRDTLLLSPGERVNHNSAGNVHGERRPMFVISVPGVNKWVSDLERAQSAATSPPSEASESAHGVKRPLEETGEEEMDTSEAPAKKLETNQVEAEKARPTALLSPEYLLNSPIPDRPSKACLVKLYSDFDDLKLNTVVDVVGFLSVDPSLDGMLDDDDDGFMEESERQAQNPPPSLIPRIHAVLLTPLKHINPLLETSLPCETLEEAYRDLKLALSQCLFEDTFAADYLIAHLLSIVHTRSDCESFGQLSLNISNIPQSALPDFTKLLYEVLEMLLPASHYFPMTLDNMNTVQFAPKKDYQTNKLTSGLLQLAPHTHLVLDETRLAVGKLEATGVEAVKHLAQLINSQRVKYNFQFYELDFDADIPVLILSEGRSMLPADCHVPLRASSGAPMHETFAAVRHFLQPRLEVIRKYLTQQKHAGFDVSPEDPDMIQNDFVKMRRENEQINAQDLHSLLVLSRLLGLMRGRTSMKQDIWEEAKELEKERRKRVAK